MRISTATLFFPAFLVAGCSQKPAEAPPTPAGAQVAAPTSQPNAAASNPHADFSDTGPPGAPFSGLVKLGEGVKPEDIRPTDVLFIMARESQGEGLAGRLIAVQRAGKIELPQRYEVSASDVMVPGIPFKGPFIVTARLDRDGDPMTRGDDDLYATYADPVIAGQEGVHLVLEKGAPKTIPAPPGVKAPPAMAPAAPASRPASKPAR